MNVAHEVIKGDLDWLYRDALCPHTCGEHCIAANVCPNINKQIVRAQHMKSKRHVLKLVQPRIDIPSRACHSGRDQQLRFVDEVNGHRPGHQTAANLPAQPTAYGRNLLPLAKWMLEDESDRIEQSVYRRALNIASGPPGELHRLPDGRLSGKVC